MSRTNLNTRTHKVLYTDGNLLNINNSAANTDLFNITIPGRLLQDGGVIRSTIYAKVDVPAGPAQGIRLRARLANSQNVPTIKFSLSPGNYFLEITAILTNRADDNNQRGIVRAAFSPYNTIGTDLVAADSGNATIDTSVDQTYALQWRWDNAVSGLAFRGRIALIELLPEP